MPVWLSKLGGLYYVIKSAQLTFNRLADFCQAALPCWGDDVRRGQFSGLPKEMVMILRWRVALALAGLALVLASLALMAYAFWPIQPLREHFRPAPTRFAPPQSLVTWEQRT